jgi:hypothetical protein
MLHNYFTRQDMFMRKTVLISILLVINSLIHPGLWSGQSNNDLYSDDNASRNTINKVYDSLNEPSLNPDAFYMAMIGFRWLCSKGLISKDSLLTIIDYSRPSSEDRFFVINLRHNSITFKTLVAHGRNSGELYASRFSNKAQSHQTALGFYITGNTYEGRQGYSLTLAGVDTGYNDHAQIRSIVIHGASYVTYRYIKQYGRLGRSFGCPALPPNLNTDIINCIKEGSVLFSYYPDEIYLNNSPVLSSLTKADQLIKPIT